MPTHVVKELGFYVVAGVFPTGARPEAKERFAREMQELGAVGFRRTVGSQMGARSPYFTRVNLPIVARQRNFS